MTSKAEVNDGGIELSYIDCGPPEGVESYRTLIAIHGYLWSPIVFQKALPEARKKGIRFIAPNRRAFPGSTPYADEELADLRSKDVDIPKFLSFFRKRGFELIGFIHQIIKKLALPTQAVDGTGSITLLGWSSGNTYLFAVMSHFNDPELPPSWKNTVKECISSAIIFDPPNDACGIPQTDLETYTCWPEKLFIENGGLTDPAKALRIVNEWVSGWFNYDHISEEEITKDALIASNDHPIRPSTIEAAPDAERLLQACYLSALDSENLTLPGITLGAFRVIVLNVLDSKARQQRRESTGSADSDSPDSLDALFSAPIPGEEDLISTKKLSWLWCENSTWPCVYSPHVHRKAFGFDGSDPMRKMVSIPNANHFLSWEEPKRFIDYVLPLL